MTTGVGRAKIRVQEDACAMTDWKEEKGKEGKIGTGGRKRRQQMQILLPSARG